MEQTEAPRQHSFLFTFLCNISIVVSLTIGLAGLVGWHFNVNSLMRVGPEHAPIRYNTSVCFLLIGLSLWAHCLELRAFSFLCATAVGVLNFLLLLQYFFGINFAIEHFIIADRYKLPEAAHLKMSPYSVAAFLLCYAAYMTGRMLRHSASGVILLFLGSAVLTLGLVSLTGYAIDLELAYNRGPFINMAPHGSIGFIVLGVLIMFSSLERELHYWLPAMLTLAGLLLTLMAFGFVLRSDRRTLAATFQLDAQNITSNLTEELKSKTAVVGAVRAFFDSSQEVERHEFRIFVSSLLEHHPGIQALEWVPIVAEFERARIEGKARSEGAANFQISELNSAGNIVPAGQRENYYPLLFIEPHIANGSVLGLDLKSDPQRLKTLEEARDSGEMIATPSMLYSYGPQPSPVIQVVYPVYKKSPSAESSAAWRRANIEGWVIAVFKISSLFMPNPTQVDLSQIGLSVFQGKTAAPANLLYRVGESISSPAIVSGDWDEGFVDNSLIYVFSLEMLRQDWLVVLNPSTAYVNSRGSWMQWIILGGGLASTTFLLALLAHFVSSRKHLSEAKLELERENSERRRAEESLASERERLNVTLRSIADGVIATNADGEIVLINQVAEDLTGWREQEAVGRSLDEVLKLEEIDHPGSSVTPGLIERARVQISSGESALATKDATRRIIAHSVAPMKGPSGKLLGMVLVVRDITMAKRTEADLLRAQKLESVGVLAGGIAHDFNNILSGIMGSISVARSLSDANDQVESKLGMAEKACLRARSLTQQLLTFSKGGTPIKKVVLLDELINDVTSLALGGTDVACQLLIEQGLMPVEADEGQLVQVINNLVINAEQATPGSGTIVIEAKNVQVKAGEIPVLAPGEYVMIGIRDRGVGISSENLSKIFDPYFTTKNNGSGLGLTAVHSIVRNHGGYVSVESKLGEGSVFRVYLPASKRAAPRQSTNVVEFPRGKGRVLVVDDEDLILQVASGMLQHLGYQVATAKGGEEALYLYREAMRTKDKFDVVILDLTIPADMDGKEIARRLLTVDKDARLVVSSGYSNDQVVADYRAYGFCHVLSKPYGIQSLGQVLREILNNESVPKAQMGNA